MDLDNDSSAQVQISEWLVDESHAQFIQADLDGLSNLLRDVVYGGGGVSFFVPFSIEEARAFWTEKILPDVKMGVRRVLLACDSNNVIVGTVQIELDMPPNQVHRAAIAKLLVHPNSRGRGIAKRLMLKLEELAKKERRTLLTLDTVSGSDAEFLYTSLGYQKVGIIPRFARGALTPELQGTTVMYKELDQD